MDGNGLDDFTMTEAAEAMGISRIKLRRMILDGTVPARQNPLDRRERLIPRKVVLRLQREGRAPAKPKRDYDATQRAKPSLLPLDVE